MAIIIIRDGIYMKSGRHKCLKEQDLASAKILNEATGVLV